MNFLPVYWKYKEFESTVRSNVGAYNIAYNFKVNNYIPAFQSSFVKKDLTLSQIKLNKLNKDNITQVLETTIILLPKLELNKQTINGSIYTSVCLPKRVSAPVTTETDGVYNLEIEFVNADSLFSDVFYLKGTPIAEYECADAYFDIEAQVFSITITRIDTNPLAFSATEFILNYYNAVTGEIVGSSQVDIDLVIGGAIDLEFSTAELYNPFDFFVWEGCCEGSYEIVVLVAENEDFLISEINDILTEE